MPALTAPAGEEQIAADRGGDAVRGRDEEEDAPAERALDRVVLAEGAAAHRARLRERVAREDRQQDGRGGEPADDRGEAAHEGPHHARYTSGKRIAHSAQTKYQ